MTLSIRDMQQQVDTDKATLGRSVRIDRTSDGITPAYTLILFNRVTWRIYADRAERHDVRAGTVLVYRKRAPLPALAEAAALFTADEHDYGKPAVEHRSDGSVYVDFVRGRVGWWAKGSVVERMDRATGSKQEWSR